MPTLALYANTHQHAVCVVRLGLDKAVEEVKHRMSRYQVTVCAAPSNAASLVKSTAPSTLLTFLFCVLAAQHAGCTAPYAATELNGPQTLRLSNCPDPLTEHTLPLLLRYTELLLYMALAPEEKIK